MLALLRRGYAFEAPPGEPIRCVRDGESLNPFDELGKIASDEDDADAAGWRALIDGTGVADEPLVERVAAQA